MRFWLLLLPFLAVAASAQSGHSGRHASGTVTGHVYCADTNAPARVASVQLAPVKKVEQGSPTHVHLNVELPAGGVAQTAFDGSFALSRVPPGSYYVIVVKAGYLSPRSNDDDGDDVEPQPPAGQPPVVVPRVDVQADQTASIDIRLERGGAISGTVRFDDGSSASGVSIMVLHRKKNKWVPSTGPIFISGGGPPTTDDLGRYRISGLRDRDYLVMIQLSRTDLESRGSGLSGVERSTLKIYSGDTAHISEAVPVKLGPGEEHSGEDITIPLNKFHSVSGVVTAAADGHAVNNGHLVIEDPNEKESVVEAELGSDGTFHLEGVPEGTYTVRVQNAGDTQHQEIAVVGQQGVFATSEKTIREYAELTQTLKVEGDIPSLVLIVTEQKRRAATTGSQ
jgi:Carboxypeptidase regulatory-like domain